MKKRLSIVVSAIFLACGPEFVADEGGDSSAETGEAAETALKAAQAGYFLGTPKSCRLSGSSVVTIQPHFYQNANGVRQMEGYRFSTRAADRIIKVYQHAFEAGRDNDRGAVTTSPNATSATRTGLWYFEAAPAGTTTVDFQVFDSTHQCWTTTNI
jgi:hypothetical protein